MKSLFLALLLPLPAATGPLNDLLMAPGLLDGAGEGPLLAYSEQRMAPDGTRAAPAANGRLLVAVAPGVQGEQFLLSREVGGKSQSLGAFPASGPNPVLLYFLEIDGARHGERHRRQPLLHPQPHARGCGGRRSRHGDKPARGGDAPLCQ